MVHSEKEKRYFIAVIPPSPVYEQALEVRTYFSDQYGSKAALKSPPHITLHMPFLWKVQKQKELFTKLQLFSTRYDPLKICLDNYGSFPPRVIFMRVTESDALQALQKDLHKFFKTKLDVFNANYKEQPFHPHLTLAFRDLKKANYHQAWQEFSKKEFKAEFMMDKIALLVHNGKSWDLLKEFPLESSYSNPSKPELKIRQG